MGENVRAWCVLVGRAVRARRLATCTALIAPPPTDEGFSSDTEWTSASQSKPSRPGLGGLFQCPISSSGATPKDDGQPSSERDSYTLNKVF